MSGNEAYTKKNEGSELQRLDDQHNAFDAYTKGKITFASLEAPKRILEVGAGSGAWTIQAAKQYPDAEVVAIDMAPLPDRPLPPNVKFRQINIFEPLPFEKGSFDLVHARFVLLHLPRPDEVLRRLADLVKPGGWISIDDIDQPPTSVPGVPGISECFARMTKFMTEQGLCPELGSSLSKWIADIGTFHEPKVHHIAFPINPGSDTDPELAPLSIAMRLSLTRFFLEDSKDGKFAGIGLTPELLQQFREEISQTGWKYDMQMYFVWAQKRA